MWKVHSISETMNCKYIIILFVYFCFPGLFLESGAQSLYTTKMISTRANDEVVSGYTQNGIIFSSNKPLTSFLKYTDAEKRNTFNMYELPVNEDGSTGIPKLFAKELTSMQNDGPASLDSTGNLIVFTRNFATKTFGNIRKENPNYGLFLADKVNGYWSNIREFDHNLPDFKTTHPALSKDGKTLYFSSDREGGIGGFDLYVSYFNNNRWSDPVNLGPKVNTEYNDVYPFSHSSGRLYFSSEGHLKPGGYDIYYTELYMNEWISPVKLPPPFNSQADDFSVLLDGKFEKGYITSTRRGGLNIFKIELNIPGFEVCKLQKADNFCFVFYETNTMEIDTSLYKYVWDMGDGTKVEAVEAEHCFGGPGDYTISLDVVDVLTREVMFNQAEYELVLKKEIQTFISCPDTVFINDEFQLDGIKSYLGEIEPGEYYWDFGDGGKAVGLSVRYKFLVPGSYNIKLGNTREAGRGEEPLKFCSYKTIIVNEK
jgi:hypothetical protein